MQVAFVRDSVSKSDHVKSFSFLDNRFFYISFSEFDRFLLRFTGKDEEVNLLGDGSEKPEFGKWSWISPEQIVDLVG